VPGAVCVYVAEQVGAACASWLSGYLDRRTTRFEHVAKITTRYGYREFAMVEAEFVRWLNDRAGVGAGEGGDGALSQPGEATARLWGRDAARGAPSGRRAVLERRRLGCSAYRLHCFIALFDPRLLVSCDVELPAYFNSRQGCSPVG
jgi:hypothetical protein